MLKPAKQANNRIDVCSVAMIIFLCSNNDEAVICRDRLRKCKVDMHCSHPMEALRMMQTSYCVGTAAVSEACTYLC